MQPVHRSATLSGENMGPDHTGWYADSPRWPRELAPVQRTLVQGHMMVYAMELIQVVAVTNRHPTHPFCWRTSVILSRVARQARIPSRLVDSSHKDNPELLGSCPSHAAYGRLSERVAQQLIDARLGSSRHQEWQRARAGQSQSASSTRQRSRSLRGR